MNLTSFTRLLAAVTGTRTDDFGAWPSHTNLISILAGDCRAHSEYASRAITDIPFDTARVLGSQGIFSSTVAELRARCERGCPRLVLLFEDLEQTRDAQEMEQLVLAFGHQRQCITSKFGGLHVDCSRVWFAFSVCHPELIVVKDLEDTLTWAESVHEARVRLKSQWGDFTTNIPLVVTLSSTGTLSLSDAIHALHQADQANRPQRNVSTPRHTRTVDLSVFDDAHFLGQEWAKRAALNAMDAVSKGLKRSNGPIVFFLLGGAGTGKTLLSKLIASAYHGGRAVSELAKEKRFALFPMAEYKSELDVDAFTSPRAGLHGTGAMIELFQAGPDPVVVLDEIEKAHPSLLNEMLLSFLDDNDGFVQNKKDTSQRYATRDAIFVLTSNCFADTIAEASARHGPGAAERISIEVERAMALAPDGSRCAWFRKKEVMRRMKAGHAFANLQRFGFVVFEPPSLEAVDAMVLHFLREYSDALDTTKLAWTANAELLLRQLARQRFTATGGGLGDVHSFLNGHLLAVIRGEMQACGALEMWSMLLFAKGGELGAKMVDCDGDGQTQSITPSNIKGVRPTYAYIAEGVALDYEVDPDMNFSWAWSVIYALAFVVMWLVVQHAPYLIPHPVTGVLVRYLWPYLGWTSSFVLLVVNAMLNTWLGPSQCMLLLSVMFLRLYK